MRAARSGVAESQIGHAKIRSPARDRRVMTTVSMLGGVTFVRLAFVEKFFCDRIRSRLTKKRSLLHSHTLRAPDRDEPASLVREGDADCFAIGGAASKGVALQIAKRDAPRPGQEGFDSSRAVSREAPLPVKMRKRFHRQDT
jgi:hypothetical protein